MKYLIWLLYGPAIVLVQKGRRGGEIAEILFGPSIIVISIPLLILYALPLGGLLTPKLTIIMAIAMFVIHKIFDLLIFSEKDYKNFYMRSKSDPRLSGIVSKCENNGYFWAWLITTIFISWALVVAHAFYLAQRF